MAEKNEDDIPVKVLKDLFSSFSMLFKLNPWEWVGDRDFFGLRINGEPEPVFVHFVQTNEMFGPSISLIFGWRSEALYQYVCAGLSHAAMRAFEIDVIRVFKQPAENLAEFERAMAVAANVSPDADGRLPIFISYEPGWLPWRITEERAKICTEIFRQAAGVIMRGESDHSLFHREDPGTVWIRTCDTKTKEYSEEWTEIEPLVDFAPSVHSMPSAEKIAQANAVPDDIEKLELDINVIPKIGLVNPDIADPSRPGRIPVGFFMALCNTDAKSDLPPCLANCIFYPRELLEQMWNMVPEALLDLFIEAKHRPHEIVVSSQMLMDFLRPLQTKIHFKLTFHSDLPFFNAVFKRTNELVDTAIQKGQNPTNKKNV